MNDYLFPAKEKVLVSKCWTGEPCRYHGRPVESPAKIKRLQAKYDCVFVCPEQLGGLPVPRPGAPLKNRRGDTIKDVNGTDLSSEFLQGAMTVLDIARRNKVKQAFLVKGSPSCDKKGFAGKMLQDNGIKVINL